jgi:hypothetical protein
LLFKALGAKCLFHQEKKLPFAGGIASSAVNILIVAEAVLENLHGGQLLTPIKYSRQTNGINSFY